jgi:hypothetical protein
LGTRTILGNRNGSGSSMRGLRALTCRGCLPYSKIIRSNGGVGHARKRDDSNQRSVRGCHNEGTILNHGVYKKQ